MSAEKDWKIGDKVKVNEGSCRSWGVPRDYAGLCARLSEKEQGSCWIKYPDGRIYCLPYGCLERAQDDFKSGDLVTVVPWKGQINRCKWDDHKATWFQKPREIMRAKEDHAIFDKSFGYGNICVPFSQCRHAEIEPTVTYSEPEPGLVKAEWDGGVLYAAKDTRDNPYERGGWVSVKINGKWISVDNAEVPEELKHASPNGYRFFSEAYSALVKRVPKAYRKLTKPDDNDIIIKEDEVMTMENAVIVCDESESQKDFKHTTDPAMYGHLGDEVFKTYRLVSGEWVELRQNKSENPKVETTYSGTAILADGREWIIPDPDKREGWRLDNVCKKPSDVWEAFHLVSHEEGRCYMEEGEAYPSVNRWEVLKAWRRDNFVHYDPHAEKDEFTQKALKNYPPGGWED